MNGEASHNDGPEVNSATMTEGAKRLAHWFLRLRILPQFRLAEELLREERRREGEQDGRPGEKSAA